MEENEEEIRYCTECGTELMSHETDMCEECLYEPLMDDDEDEEK